MHLLGTAGGPVGGDELHLEVLVTAGTVATVRSVAATVATVGDGTASFHTVNVTVEQGAFLRWLPQPLVAAEGCDHHLMATVILAPGADLIWSEHVVLGRHGEQPGRLRSTLRVIRDGRAVLHHGLDTAQPGWQGAAVTAGRRALGVVAWVGAGAVAQAPDGGAPVMPQGRANANGVRSPRDCWTVSRLAPDVVLAQGLANSHAGLAGVLWPDRVQSHPGRSTLAGRAKIDSRA